MLRSLLLVLLGISLLAFYGCGDKATLAPGIAAQSGEEAISKKEVERWMVAFAQTPGKPFRRVPDAPSFAGCAEGIAESERAPQSLAARKEACRKGYKTLQDEALTWLLNQAELTRQAKKRGLYQKINLETRRKLSKLAKNKNFAQELKLAGLNEEMVYQRIFTNSVGQAITNEAKRAPAKPNAGEIKAYLLKEKREINEKNKKVAAAELLASKQEKAVRGEFAGIAKQLKEETTCLKDYRVSFCGRISQ